MYVTKHWSLSQCQVSIYLILNLHPVNHALPYLNTFTFSVSHTRVQFGKRTPSLHAHKAIHLHFFCTFIMLLYSISQQCPFGQHSFFRGNRNKSVRRWWFIMVYDSTTCDSAASKTQETTRIGLEYASNLSHRSPGQPHMGQIAPWEV